jgi:hypothetical protein
MTRVETTMATGELWPVTFVSRFCSSTTLPN